MYKLIDTRHELEQLSSLLLTKRIIALDLEGEFNLHRYGIHLCLLQIGTEDEIFLVDKITLGNIDPLREVIESEKIEKVMYSANIDVRLLKYACGFNIRNIFDLRIGAKLIGLEDQSLGGLITFFTGARIDKNKRFQMSDWSRRPLGKDQLDYAADDVHYLIPVRERINEMLAIKRMTKQFIKANKILENEIFKDTENNYLKTPNSGKLNKNERVILKHIYNMREEIAEELDVPAYRVIRKENLYNIVRHLPVDKVEWRKVLNISNRDIDFSGRFEDAVNAAVEEIKSLRNLR